MIGNSVAQKKYGMRTLFPWKEKKKSLVINNFQGMSSGHWVNINTWQMDICWFKLKWKLLKGKKWGSYFSGKKLTCRCFFLFSKPHTGFYSTAFLPLPPGLDPPSPPQWFVGQLWRAGAAAGAPLSPQPCSCGFSRRSGLAGTPGGPWPNLLPQARSVQT